jgi:hypothetical protein
MQRFETRQIPPSHASKQEENQQQQTKDGPSAKLGVLERGAFHGLQRRQR